MKKLFSLIIFLLILISVISPLTIVKGEEINSNQYLILGGAEYVKENAVIYNNDKPSLCKICIRINTR